MTGEHLVDVDDTKPPAGWQVIDGATGGRAIAEADAAKIIRGWFELEMRWREQQ